MSGSKHLVAAAGAAAGDAAGDAARLGEAVAGAAEGEGEGDAEGFAEGLAAGLADGLGAAFGGPQIRVSWPYLAKTASLMTDGCAVEPGFSAASRSAAFCGPIFWMSGTWQVMQRSTMNCPLTWTLGNSCCTSMGKS